MHTENLACTWAAAVVGMVIMAVSLCGKRDEELQDSQDASKKHQRPWLPHSLREQGGQGR